MRSSVRAQGFSFFGHGHVYAPQNHIDAWTEVTAVDWPASEIERLKQYLAGRYQ